MPNIIIGTIMAYAGPITPAWEQTNGWLLCDGRSLPRNPPGSRYYALFNAIGTSWGGDAVNMFNIPDLQGRFLRGVNNNTGRDPDINVRVASMPGGHIGDNVGSVQPGATALAANIPFSISQAGPHTHHLDLEMSASRDPNAGVWNTVANPHVGTVNKYTDADGAHTHNLAGGDLETRPINANVFWIICYAVKPRVYAPTSTLDEQGAVLLTPAGQCLEKAITSEGSPGGTGESILCSCAVPDDRPPMPHEPRRSVRRQHKRYRVRRQTDSGLHARVDGRSRQLYSQLLLPPSRLVCGAA